MEGVLEFLHLIGKLKAIPRTGWVLRNVRNPETIAGHMYRMGIMVMMLPEENSGLDKNRCLKMALVHDIGECIVGDITPYCNVSTEEKHRQEKEAVNHLSSLMGVEGQSLISLYQEYVAQETSEAKFVKELDRLDMVIQAFEYEIEEKTPKRLEEFFISTEGKFKHPWTMQVIAELNKKRNEKSDHQDGSELIEK